MDAFLFPVTRVIEAIYLFVAFRIFYRDSVLFALLKAAIVAWSLIYIVQLYRFILFLTALYTS